MFTNKLIALKSARNLTNQQISEMSNVPLSTITRIFNGQTENPNIQTIVDIVKAMDGSMDEILGLRTGAAKETEDRLVQLYQQVIRDKNRSIKVLTWVLLVIGTVLMGILVYDILNGNVGYVRY